MKFQIKNIEANPFRHLDTYPIDPEKIKALTASFDQTGFWENIVARKVNGKAQIAYGHHRREVLLKKLRPTDEVDLIIKDLDDATMLQIMANENMHEWGTSASVEQETVRAVVDAFAKGQIKLRPVSTNTRKLTGTYYRYAPHYQPGPFLDANRDVAYTEATVAQFLGWVYGDGKAHHRVSNALAALALIEENILDNEDYHDLSTTQAEVVTKQTNDRRTNKNPGESQNQADHSARRVGKQLAQDLRDEKVSVKQAKHTADMDRTLSSRPRQRIASNYDELVQPFLDEMAAMLAQHGRLQTGLREISEHQEEISPHLLKKLVEHLRRYSTDLADAADTLETGQPDRKKRRAFIVEAS
jgi:ParB-like chromosome segregation protein Spo0J